LQDISAQDQDIRALFEKFVSRNHIPSTSKNFGPDNTPLHSKPASMLLHCFFNNFLLQRDMGLVLEPNFMKKMALLWTKNGRDRDLPYMEIQALLHLSNI
jgi:hypothetical protein